jgi:hypothetical protein
MNRNSKRLSGWIVLAVIALSVGMIGAGEQPPPKGPLGFLYGQIHALFVEADQLAVKSDDQQEQIDQLTGTVCGLSALTGNPAPPELCEVVVTAVCASIYDLAFECSCDPGPFFELESCESAGDFPSPCLTPDPGEAPPKCDWLEGCRGTFTRIAAGDETSIEVEARCGNECSGPGCGGCPSECQGHCVDCDSGLCCQDPRCPECQAGCFACDSGLCCYPVFEI